MTKDELVSTVKPNHLRMARDGDVEGSYTGYKDPHFSRSWVFHVEEPEEQRQALKLLVLAKRSGAPSARQLL